MALKERKKTKRELLQEKKDEIISKGYPTLDVISFLKKKRGTIYLVEKTNYSFHIYFIFEPVEVCREAIAGADGIISEMYYNLRDREYWIKRSDKEVKFSERNVDSIFKGETPLEVVFDFVSTEHSKEMFQSAFHRLGSIGDEKVSMFGRFLYRLMTEYSGYELAYKSGFNFNVGHMINRNGRSLEEIFGISKTSLKMARKFGLSIDYLVELRHNSTPERDKKAFNFLNYLKKLDEIYDVEIFSDMYEIKKELDFIYSRYSSRYSNSIHKTNHEYGGNLNKQIEYVFFACNVSQGLSPAHAIANYHDYLRMCVQMRLPVYEKYPKYLKTLHDVISRNYNLKINSIEQQMFEEQVERLKEYSYKYNGYQIIAPSKPDDIVKEGNNLHHCVASYVKSVIRGTKSIIFMRKSDTPEDSLITIELRDNKIAQARGKFNRNMDDDEKKFLTRFAKKFNLDAEMVGLQNFEEEEVLV